MVLATFISSTPAPGGNGHLGQVLGSILSLVPTWFLFASLICYRILSERMEPSKHSQTLFYSERKWIFLSLSSSGQAFGQSDEWRLYQALLSADEYYTICCKLVAPPFYWWICDKVRSPPQILHPVNKCDGLLGRMWLFSFLFKNLYYSSIQITTLWR